MILTAELKADLLARMREEFEDDDDMTSVIVKIDQTEVGYDLDSVDRDPTWDDQVEDTNWVLAWLEYFRLVGS